MVALCALHCCRAWAVADQTAGTAGRGTPCRCASQCRYMAGGRGGRGGAALTHITNGCEELSARGASLFLPRCSSCLLPALLFAQGLALPHTCWLLVHFDQFAGVCPLLLVACCTTRSRGCRRQTYHRGLWHLTRPQPKCGAACVCALSQGLHCAAPRLLLLECACLFLRACLLARVHAERGCMCVMGVRGRQPHQLHDDVGGRGGRASRLLPRTRTGACAFAPLLTHRCCACGISRGTRDEGCKHARASTQDGVTACAGCACWLA